jgi:hypothetical protein
MGLLDEAIKEHLDLKRRRGADPEDVAREEREALGPAVREVRESMTGDGAAAPAEAAPAAIGDEATEATSPAPGGAATVEEHTPPAPEPAPADQEPPATAPADEPPVDQSTQVFDAGDLFAEEDDALVPDPEAPPEGGDRPPADPDAVRPDPEAPSPPTEGAARPAEGEDVLEETPDFLQETPEHDRLWFEQKPPRDFDFDK